VLARNNLARGGDSCMGTLDEPGYRHVLTCERGLFPPAIAGARPRAAARPR
jgi:hypothetical protein